MSAVVRALAALFLVAQLVVAAAPAAAAPVNAAAPAGEIATELIVGLTADGQTRSAAVHARAGGVPRKQLGSRGVHLVTVDARRAETAKTIYRADPRVRFVEHNAHVHATGLTNDPLLSEQWGLTRIEAPAAWDVAPAGA